MHVSYPKNVFGHFVIRKWLPAVSQSNHMIKYLQTLIYIYYCLRVVRLEQPFIVKYINFSMTNIFVE